MPRWEQAKAFTLPPAFRNFFLNLIYYDKLLYNLYTYNNKLKVIIRRKQKVTIIKTLSYLDCLSIAVADKFIFKLRLFIVPFPP